MMESKNVFVDCLKSKCPWISYQIPCKFNISFIYIEHLKILFLKISDSLNIRYSLRGGIAISGKSQLLSPSISLLSQANIQLKGNGRLAHAHLLTSCVMLVVKINKEEERSWWGQLKFENVLVGWNQQLQCHQHID